ncbi:MAG: glycosyltransferase family 2 protein [Thermoproteaceae archaeon]|nr:glycosyltransferase family 2 protein [Thermoproteaceae archaeon]
MYIIIVNHNGRELLRKCLLSLRKTQYSNYRALVVDNGSRDGSVETVKREFPEVEVIALPKNLGYARANNFGIIYALRHNAEYIVLLNNDTEILDSRWLYLAVRIMEKNKDIGILGFNLILPNGASQQYYDKTKPWEVNEVVFAAAMVRAVVFRKVGILDHDYVIGYAENVDFCYRVRRCNLKVVYVPQIRIHHARMATFKKVPRDILLQISARNNFRHFILNKSLHELFKWLLMAFIGVRDGKIVLRNDARRLKWITYGFISYVREKKLQGLIKLLVERLRRRALYRC